MIRKNNQIEGVQIRNLECKISQFADDTTCFPRNLASVHAVKDTLNLFAAFSGLCLNMDKCAILSLGPQTHPTDHVAGFKLASKVKILGVWFAYERNAQDHYEWNFRPQLDRMRACCSSWNSRSISLKGKVTVYNSLMISLLQYICTKTSPSKGAPGGAKVRLLFSLVKKEEQDLVQHNDSGYPRRRPSNYGPPCQD